MTDTHITRPNMKISVFEYKTTAITWDRLSTTGSTRGWEAGCRTHRQPAFITRVLNEELHMSPERAPVDELSATEEEGHFFMPVLYGRSVPKRSSISKQIDERSQAKRVHGTRGTIMKSRRRSGRYYSQHNIWLFTCLLNFDFKPKTHSLNVLISRHSWSQSTRSTAAMDWSQVLQTGEGKKRIHIDKNSPWVSDARAVCNRGFIAFQTLKAMTCIFHQMGIIQFLKNNSSGLDLGWSSVKLVASAEEDSFALNIDLFRFKDVNLDRVHKIPIVIMILVSFDSESRG